MSRRAPIVEAEDEASKIARNLQPLLGELAPTARDALTRVDLDGQTPSARVAVRVGRGGKAAIGAEMGIGPKSAVNARLHERCGFRIVGLPDRIGSHHGHWRTLSSWSGEAQPCG
jgi:hypothetical protein